MSSKVGIITELHSMRDSIPLISALKLEPNAFNVCNFSIKDDAGVF